MADVKISALPASTTPLAGTEVLPVVQSNVTVQVSVADLTAGRAVSASSLSLTGGAVIQGLTVGLGANAVAGNTAVGVSALATNTGSTNTVLGNGAGSSLTTGSNNTIIGSVAGTAGLADTVIIAAGSAERMRIDSSGNMTVATGNITPSTAAKGINFTANTGAAGKTSQLLNWYEEGTWTPGFATWSTAPTVSAAYYTRVGRQVTINLYLFGGVHVEGYISGLPFTSGSGAAGSWCCSNTPSIYGNIYILPTATYLGLNSITMTGNYWQFGITYFV